MVFVFKVLLGVLMEKVLLLLKKIDFVWVFWKVKHNKRKRKVFIKKKINKLKILVFIFLWTSNIITNGFTNSSFKFSFLQN